MFQDDNPTPAVGRTFPPLSDGRPPSGVAMIRPLEKGISMMTSTALAFVTIVGFAQSLPHSTDDYAAALTAARRSHKPLIVLLDDAGATSGFSERLLRVSPELLARFEICRLDVRTPYGDKVANLYHATQFPYTVITDAKCRSILFRGAGEFSADSLIATLSKLAPTSHLSDINRVHDLPAETSLSMDKSSTLSPFAHADLRSAQRAARKAKRPLLVVVSMTPCHFCDKLKSETLQDERVANRIGEKFESVMIDEAEYQDWVREQEITIFPTVVITSPSGQLLDRIDGFVPPSPLRLRLEKATGTQVTSR